MSENLPSDYWRMSPGPNDSPTFLDEVCEGDPGEAHDRCATPGCVNAPALSDYCFRCAQNIEDGEDPRAED